MNTYNIVYEADPMLTVHIDRSNMAGLVRYSYTGNDIEMAATCFQTADMPRDDQEAAAKINDWLDCQAG
jgi:hypothetical protein